MFATGTFAELTFAQLPSFGATFVAAWAVSANVVFGGGAMVR